MNLIEYFKPHRILLICCLAFAVIPWNAAYNPLFPDFPGPYCASSKLCCNNRKDSCAMPISDSSGGGGNTENTERRYNDGTLCYCDAFCERDKNSDCCPDYVSYCRGGPDEVNVCYYNGKYFKYMDKLQDNCNTCKCTMGGKMECTQEVCLTDEALIHNVNLISSSLGWEARNYSEFWGHTYKEGLKLRLGTKEPSRKVKSMSQITNRATVLPQHFNAINHFDLNDEIYDQGWCGSSWVMSTISVASNRFAVQSKGREKVQLSPQHLLSCSSRSQGCNGGHLDVAWRYLNRKGVVDDDCYPYNPQNIQCKIRGDNLQRAGCSLPETKRTEFYRMGPAYSLHNETDIMSEIMKSGPVQATLRVYRDFFSYSQGIYRHSAASRSEQYGFHSVRLVGWGEEPGYNSIKYWIAANSWGDWWGEDGYFRILRGSNECLIEDYVLASWPHVHDDIKPRKHIRGRRAHYRRRNEKKEII